MLIPSLRCALEHAQSSLSRRVNANSQQCAEIRVGQRKLIKKGEC